MIPFVIENDLATTLNKYYIRKFSGPKVKDFSAGEKIRARPNSVVEEFSRHPPGLLMELGAFSYASASTPAILNMKVGRYCSIAQGVSVFDGVHPISAVTSNPFAYGEYYREGTIPEEFLYKGPKAKEQGSYGKAIVGNDVWIGAYCTIKAGIRIGDGAVIAGGANVVKDVSPYAIVGGNPAKVIRYRFNQDIIDRLVKLSWWRFRPDTFSHFDMTNPEVFCMSLEESVTSGNAFNFKPVSVTIGKQGGFSVNP